MSERTVNFLLKDISEAISNIIAFTENISFESYCSDIKTKHAVEHNFMIIGEAVARIPEEFKKSHAHINWRQIKDFRNVIVHDYFGIDNNIVWDIIILNIPGLLNVINGLLEKESE
ncbi:MAG: DUF86 domain-containing protein [Flavitalea sp.]